MRRLLITLFEIIGKFRGWFERSPFGTELLRAYRVSYWRGQLAAFGDGSHIYPCVVIHSPERVRLGRRVNIAEFVHIWGGGGVEIGDNVVIASHVVITSQTHNRQAEVYRDSQKMAPVRIEANCWIGAGAIVLPGVHVGEGAVIGAQAVVTKDVAPRSVVVGVPARMRDHDAGCER